MKAAARARPAARGAWGLALLSIACGRSSATTAPDAAPGQAENVPQAQGPDASPPLAEPAPPATLTEARRSRLATLDDEPGLAANAAAIQAHFDGGVPAALDLEAVPLGGGRQGLMVSAGAEPRRPMALLVDAQGVALWTRERPFAGITPPVGPFALAPRPDNGLGLFLYDEPTKLVAARMWSADGAPFSDMELFELPRCDALSVVWWPERGWIVVASYAGGARAQRLLEQGTVAWDPQGIAVGEPWRVAAPVTLVVDPPSSSWLVVQHATRGGSDHVVATRYAAQGGKLGESMDLGPVPRVAHPDGRIAARLAREGVVAVDVNGKPVEVVIASMR